MVDTQISFTPDSEGLEERLDRLNLAIKNVFEGLSSSQSYSDFLEDDSSPRSSIAPSECYENESILEDFHFLAEDFELPEPVEHKLDDLVLAMERKQMLIEDFLSKSQRTVQVSCENLSQVVEQLKKLRNRQVTPVTLGTLTMNIQLNNSNHSPEENQPPPKSELEQQLALEINGLKAELELHLRENTPNNTNTHKEIADLKQKLALQLAQVSQKTKDLAKKETELKAKQASLLAKQAGFEKAQSSLDTHRSHQFTEIVGIRDELEKALEVEPTQGKTAISEFISKVDQLQANPHKVESLQNKLQTLQSQVNPTAQKPDQKIQVEIDRMKTKISTLRGEQAILASYKNSELIKSKFSAMERGDDVNLKRRELLKRLTAKTGHNYMTKYKPRPRAATQPTSPTMIEQPKLPSQPRNEFYYLKKHCEQTRRLQEARRLAMDTKESLLTQANERFIERWGQPVNAETLVTNLSDTLQDLNSEKVRIEEERKKLVADAATLAEKKEKIHRCYKEYLEEFQRERERLIQEKQNIQELKLNLRNILPSLKELIVNPQ